MSDLKDSAGYPVKAPSGRSPSLRSGPVDATLQRTYEFVRSTFEAVGGEMPTHEQMVSAAKKINSALGRTFEVPGDEAANTQAGVRPRPRDPSSARRCSVSDCTERDDVAPYDGTWPTCSDKQPLCRKHRIERGATRGAVAGAYHQGYERGAKDGAAEMRERAAHLMEGGANKPGSFTNGAGFCRLTDHAQEMCECAERAAAIRSLPLSEPEKKP